MPRTIRRRTVTTTTTTTMTEEVIVDTGPTGPERIAHRVPCTEEEIETPIVIIPVRFPPQIQKNPYSIGSLFNQQPTKRRGLVRFK